jgi:predicted house-cleaning noncanonical NTP pyrophosphatase (MazG superfamily)
MSENRILQKLVRDKLPELLKAQGITAHFHKADHDEYEIELLEKLREEVIEFKNAKSMDELADLLETVDAVIHHFGWSQADIQSTKDQLKAEKGGYQERLILERTE